MYFFHVFSSSVGIPRAALMNYHKPGDLKNNRNSILFSHCSGLQEFEMRMLQGWLLLGGSEGESVLYLSHSFRWFTGYSCGLWPHNSISASSSQGHLSSVCVQSFILQGYQSQGLPQVSRW